MSARPRFSARTAWDLSENPLAAALSRARAEGRALVDLTESNPTRVGIADSAAAVAALGHPRGTRYEPAPLGHEEARAAVVAYYAERGLSVKADRLVLSASTSESYGWLLKLLCERGDRVLVPAPSYPLLSFLAGLEDVELAPYPIALGDRWRVDLDALEAAVDERTRAIVLVHPNNPTGSFVTREEAAGIEAIAARHGLAIVVDEVFGDFAHGPLPPDRLPSFAGRDAALTFVLSGLSKVALLPQLKLGWIAIGGPEAHAAEALARLEVVADTYLSVGTPVQRALPEILGARRAIQDATRARVVANLAAVDAAIAALGPRSGLRRLPTDGGWYAMLEAPRALDEDAWVRRLVEEHGVVVHPGYFFDADGEGIFVVSLLPEPEPFARAIGAVVRALGAG